MCKIRRVKVSLFIVLSCIKLHLQFYATVKWNLFHRKNTNSNADILQIITSVKASNEYLRNYLEQLTVKQINIIQSHKVCFQER